MRESDDDGGVAERRERRLEELRIAGEARSPARPSARALRRVFRRTTALVAVAALVWIAVANDRRAAETCDDGRGGANPPLGVEPPAEAEAEPPSASARDAATVEPVGAAEGGEEVAVTAVGRRGALAGGASLTATGYVVPRSGIVEVSARAPGRIEEVRVSVGDRVATGDLLVRLDDRVARAAVEQIRARLAAARAEQALAAARSHRLRRLREARLVAAEEWERQRAAAILAGAVVREHEAALDRQLLELEFTEVRAPCDGVVLEVRREVGEVVSLVPEGAAWLLSLTDPSEVRVVADVHESDLGLVRIDQPATVELDASPGRIFRARTVAVSPRANRQKGTVAIELTLLDPDERVRPDASARIRLLPLLASEAPDPRRG
jgi:RND family efflux transporter MFP subunit